MSKGQAKERVFGKIDLYRKLDSETVLGVIDQIPIYNRASIGGGKATITDQRFVFESEIIDNSEKKGIVSRDVIYYEVGLDKIDGIDFKSSDVNVPKGNTFGFIAFLIIGLILLIAGFVGGIEMVAIVIGFIVLAAAFVFIPHHRRYRCLTLKIETSSGTFVFGNQKGSDVPLIVTNECVSKMTLLVKGIRQAQR